MPRDVSDAGRVFLHLVCRGAILDEPVRIIATLIIGAATLFGATQNIDFGAKFFDDLRKLFGQLQQSELDQAFRRANSIRCRELVSNTGEWKQVAFLNDDRKLGDWHYDSIDEVKKDLTKYVFSGGCVGEQGPVKVVTSFPLQRRDEASGRTVRENNPVSVVFDSTANTYVFLLPYLYLERRDADGSSLYTEHPPRYSSIPEPNVSEEFRCKALTGPELTYRFLICRTRIVDRDRPERSKDRPLPPKQPLGNAAYQILSDGKEASSSVKLTFGDDVEPKGRVVPAPAPAPAPAPVPASPQPSDSWLPAPPQAKLVDVSQDEFRLSFNAEARARIGSPQFLTAQTISAFVPESVGRDREYCVWEPLSTAPFGSDSALFSLGFSKSAQSVISAVFTVQALTGSPIATLHCYFPQSQTPADITVARWTAIVGTHITLESRRHERIRMK
jgi:hypothetical protein